MADVPLEVLIAEAHREVRMRRRVYPDWVERGRMSQTEASQRIANMEAIAATLEGLRPPPPQGSLVLDEPPRA